jgi:hypothetical protein
MKNWNYHFPFIILLSTVLFLFGVYLIDRGLKGYMTYYKALECPTQTDQ